MICASCGNEAPPGSAFCNACGAKLGTPGNSPAASTHGDRAPGEYTPRHLAEKILQSRSALKGERKQVTVLFADVKQSTALAEQLDPEDWHRILERFFEILTEGVHRFEGTVNQYTGDGIMALFGAPIAHEDHALRACHAALRLRDELRRYMHELKRTRGLPFATRMGLSSGEVVVGKIGDDLRMDYTAQGATVNLAARLEALADPGSVYLAPETARQVAGYFDLTDLGSFELQGMAEPVCVHELAGVGPLRTRFDAARARGLSRFVGREREMELLEEALAEAEAGHGRIVGIVAPAGTGKTRLAFEFVERCRTRGLEVTMTSTSPWGRAIPLQHFLDILRNLFGIEDADDPETCREKIAGRMLRLDPELAQDVPLMFDVLGVPDPARPAPPLDPEGRKEFLLRLFRHIFAAHTDTWVHVRDDIQWIDPTSEAITAVVNEHIEGDRRLMIHTYRPEYRPPWRDRTFFRELPLEQLGDEATRTILADWLGPDPSVVALEGRIADRAAGNPFFLEELVRSLAEDGLLEGSRGAYRLAVPAEEIAVPESVDAVLAARMDRLPESDKALLQTASVIGKTVSPQLLGELADRQAPDLEASLARLVDAEFLATEAGNEGLEYAFVHPLTQEVAYRSQLRERRRATHARLAVLLEERYAERLDEKAALLAHHTEAAGDDAAAARWHRRAARWIRRLDLDEARRHWRHVLRLLEQGEENEENLGLGVEAAAAILDWEPVTGLDAADAEAIASRGRQRAEKLGDRRGLARILSPHSVMVGLVDGDVARALAMAEEAAALARGFEEDRELQAVVHYNLSIALATHGRAAAALAAVEHGLSHAPRALLFRTLHAFRLAAVGRLDEAWREIQEAREDAAHRRLLAALSIIEENLGYIAYCRGDYTLALAQHERVLRAAEQSGDRLGQCKALRLRGTVLIELGRAQEAVQAFEEVERTAPARVATWSPAALRPYLAEALAESHRLGSARRLVAEWPSGLLFLEGFRPNLLHGARALIALGEESELARAEALLDDLDALVREGGAMLWVPHILVARARLSHARDDRATAERSLREAERRYVETGAHLRADHLRKVMQA